MGLLNLRNALMAGKRLPYDAEVEYLESTGTQYIDTGVTPSSSTSVEVVYKVSSTQLNTCIFSARTSVESNSFSVWNDVNGHYRFDFTASGADNKNGPSSIVGSYVSLKKDGNRNFVDGVEITANAQKSFSCVHPAYLFAMNNGGIANFFVSAMVASCKIWQNGVLVRDYIPVRKGTVGYLYDRVSGKLFGNAGTGDFVLGPDVVPVEYIESHGTEYIDTGVKVADPSTISISVDSDGVTPFGFVHNNVAAGTWLGINIRTSATEVAVYRKDFNVRDVIEFSAGRHTFKWDGATGFQIDGVSKSSFTATVGTDAIDSISWRLFGRYDFQYSAINGRGASKFYRANIETSGISARKYRPVRVGTDATSWKGAMMDVLTRRIYRNAGTGAFTYGNDLKCPIPVA